MIPRDHQRGLATGGDGERLQEVAWAGYQQHVVGREVDCATWQRRRAAGCHWLLPGCRRSPAPGPSTPQACTTATEVPGRGSYHRVALSRATGWPQPGRVVLGEGRACIQSTRLCVARPRLPPSLPALQQLAATDCCPEEPSERARRHGLHARLDWHHSPCHASQDRRLRRKDRPQAPRLGRRASVHGQFPTIQKSRCSPRSYSTSTSTRSELDGTDVARSVSTGPRTPGRRGCGIRVSAHTSAPCTRGHSDEH